MHIHTGELGSLSASDLIYLVSVLNCIDGVMVSVLVSSVIDCGSNPNMVKPKTK